MNPLGSGSVAAPSWRKPLIFLTYVTVFNLGLPILVWRLGHRLDRLLGLPALEQPALRIAGWLIALFGTSWMLWSIVLFRWIGRGWPMSHLAPTRLVATGPYRWTRHPIYAGFTAVVCGAGLVVGSPGLAVGMTVLVTACWVIYVLGFEEPRLIRRYGTEYRAYRAHTSLMPVPLGRTLARAGTALWQALSPIVERLANYTVLFRLGGTLFVTYGLCAAIGAFLTGVVLITLSADAGMPARLIGLYIVLMAIAVAVGSRLMWLLYHLDRLRTDLLGTLRQVGFVSWGGFIGFLAGTVVFAWATNAGPLRLLDHAMLAGLTGYPASRLGCLTYGCCYGRPSPLGLRWTDPAARVVRELGELGRVPRVPTPLAASLLALPIAALLYGVTTRPVPAGTVAGLGLLLYALMRFGVDCLRDERRMTSWALTSGQIGSFAAAGIGVVLLFVARGAPAWPRPALTTILQGGLPLLPLLLACVLGVFVVFGMHRDRIGHW